MARKKLVPEDRPDVKTRFQPGNKPLAPPTAAPKRYSLFEVRLQMQAVEGLMIAGASEGQILRAMRKHEKMPIGAKRTKNLIERVKSTWAQEDENQRAVKKAAQERRLIQTIEQAKGVADEESGRWKDANFQAIVAAERLLADIQGTREPTKIQLDLQVSVAVAHLIASMTPDQVQSALADQREMERDAQNWRMNALPAKAG